MVFGRCHLLAFPSYRASCASFTGRNCPQSVSHNRCVNCHRSSSLYFLSSLCHLFDISLSSTVILYHYFFLVHRIRRPYNIDRNGESVKIKKGPMISYLLVLNGPGGNLQVFFLHGWNVSQSFIFFFEKAIFFTSYSRTELGNPFEKESVTGWWTPFAPAPFNGGGEEAHEKHTYDVWREYKSPGKEVWGMFW